MFFGGGFLDFLLRILNVWRRGQGIQKHEDFLFETKTFHAVVLYVEIVAIGEVIEQFLFFHLKTKIFYEKNIIFS